jgi:hypothetical protein
MKLVRPSLPRSSYVGVTGQISETSAHGLPHYAVVYAFRVSENYWRTFLISCLFLVVLEQYSYSRLDWNVAVQL